MYISVKFVVFLIIRNWKKNERDKTDHSNESSYHIDVIGY